MLKSRLAARDRGRADAAVKPPTAEAVRSTVLKLTGMVERKGREVEYLEEKVRRLRGRSVSAGGSGVSSGGGTPRGPHTPGGNHMNEGEPHSGSKRRGDDRMDRGREKRSRQG